MSTHNDNPVRKLLDTKLGAEFVTSHRSHRLRNRSLLEAREDTQSGGPDLTSANIDLRRCSKGQYKIKGTFGSVQVHEAMGSMCKVCDSI